jgi:hypothetical protein
MKDFLQGRASVTPTRSNASSLSIPSNLPPISQNAVTLEPPTPPLEDLNPIDFEEAPPSTPPPHLLEEPRVEMVPDAEGRIGHIVVTCRCGEIITLQCNY